MAIKEFNGYRTRIPGWAKLVKATIGIPGDFDFLAYRGFIITNADDPRIDGRGIAEGPFFVFDPDGEPADPIFESLEDCRAFIDESAEG